MFYENLDCIIKIVSEEVTSEITYNCISSKLVDLYNVVQWMYRGDYMAFSIRMTPKEKKLAQSYANLHSISLSKAFIQTLFEKIEDEYDLKAAQDAYNEFVESGKKSRPIENVWTDFDL